MIINIKSKKYNTSEKPLIMGILNLSTDSPIAESVTSVDLAVSRAKQLISEGATIIDVGADSTSSKAADIDLREESKLIHLGKLFEPSGNTESDLLNVHNYFRQFKGKRPEFS